MASRSQHHSAWVLMGVLLALGLPGACQKESPVRPASGTEARLVQLKTGRSTIQPGDTTMVRARAVEGAEPGTPAAGAAVTFGEPFGKHSGEFAKEQSVTDATGTVATVFQATAGDSGLVTIKATLGTSVRYSMVMVASGSASGLTMSVQTAGGQTSLPADGHSQIEITTTVVQGSAQTPVAALPLVITAGDQFLDENSNGVFDQGDQVVPAGDRNGNGLWDPQGTAPERVTTNNEGIARFIYQAGGDVGAVFVRLTVEGQGQSTEIELVQHSLALDVALTTGARELLADGVSLTPVGISVRDWSGHGIGGVLVKLVAGEPFTDANGDGYFTPGTDQYTDLNANGHWDTMGTITSVVSTDGSGNATASYQAGLRPGETTLRATTTSGFTQGTLRLLPVPPASQIAIHLTQDHLYADGNSTTSGVVEVRNINDTPLAGKSVHLVAGERFEDVNGDGLFTPGIDRLLEDLDGNNTWTAIGEIPASVTTGADGRAGFVYKAGLISHQIYIRAAVDSVSQEIPLTLQPLPTTQSLIVTAASDRLTVHHGGGVDQTLIIAVCYDVHGAPVPSGVPITFSIVSGPGGGESLVGAVAGVFTTQTDTDGSAGATLLAGTKPGLIQVGASSGALLSSTGIYVEAGLAASIACAADSTSLLENSSCQVRAYIYDQARNAVKDGTVVLFHADEGMIVTANGQGSALTSAGVAVATFTAVPNQAGGDGTAEIVAETNGGINGGISCTSYIQMPGPPGAISRLTMSPEAPEIAVMGTGGREQVRIMAQGFDCYRRPVGATRSVTFRITEGPGGGEHLLCEGDSAVVLTDASGTAAVVLESGTISGTVVVSAQPTGVNRIAEHTPVGIAAGPPVYISVGTEECNVLVCGVVNAPNKVVAVLSDLYHNPVRNGTAVYFTTSNGMIEGNQGLGTSSTLRGVATGLWHSDGQCGMIMVTSSTQGGSLVSSSSFIGSGLPYSTSFLSPAADTVSINADGKSVLPYILEVLDQNSLYPLPTDVEVSAIYGKVDAKIKTDDGCSGSLAQGKYTSVVLTADDSYTVPDDGIGGVDAVHAAGGFGPVSDTFLVRLRTGRSSANKSTIDLGSVPPGLMAIFSVTIKDGWGNPLGGHVLSLRTAAGAVDSTGVTDQFGQAAGLTFVAPAETGSVLLEVRDLDPRFGGSMILRKSITIAMP